MDTESRRVFPPLYFATGNASRDRLAFIHVLERLKVNSDLQLGLIPANFALDAATDGLG
jgi:hypothetical protein